MHFQTICNLIICRPTCVLMMQLKCAIKSLSFSHSDTAMSRKLPGMIYFIVGQYFGNMMAGISSSIFSPVCWQYYGTLRLLVADSGAACVRLTNQPGLVPQLVAAAQGDGPYGVHHEACRLLARMIRTTQ